MRVLVASAIVVTACSGAGNRAPGRGGDEPAAVDAGVVVGEPPGYRLPAAEPAPTYTVECTDFGAGAVRVDRRVYDLGSITLPSAATAATAPTIDERPRRGMARTPRRIQGAFARRHDAITACWKWAQAKDALAATRVTLALRVDPWGRITALDAVEPRAEDAELLACVDDVMATAMVSGVTTRWTRATVTLDFRLADQPAWKKKPKRPAAPAPGADERRAGTRCTPVQSGVDDDALAVVEPLSYSDHDDAREPPAPNRRTRGRMTRGPAWQPKHDRHERLAMQRAVRANLGAFARCHADARGRDPTLAGRISARWVLGEDGVPADVDVAGAGDATLHGCLRDAIAALWIPPDAPGTFELIQHFTVGPPVAIDERDGHRAALAHLAAHDPVAALARWEAQLVADPRSLDSCEYRAGVLRASIARAPWLDDARVRGALTDLVAQVRGFGPEESARCLAPARASIDLLLGRAAWIDDATAYDDVWRERLAIVDTLVPIANKLDDNGRLALVHALGIALSDPRHAIELLRPLVDRGGAVGEQAAEALAELTGTRP